MNMPEFPVQKISWQDFSKLVIPPTKFEKQNRPIVHFRDVVLLHKIKNEIAEILKFEASAIQIDPPLILAIQGSAGQGKSYQTRQICSLLDVYIVPISGALLSGSHEGDAFKLLEMMYINASIYKEEYQRSMMLLIEDFDLSVASPFANREYTVNSQLLVGFLMNLADNPTRCGTQTTHRIPIILTGNNFQGLPEPLVRDGRVDFFDWEPSLEQKDEIVRSIFSSLLAREELPNIKKLVEAYPNKPISFFAMLRNDILDDVILEMDKDRERLSHVKEAVITYLYHGKMSFQKLLLFAEKRVTAKPNDFLKPS